MRDYFTEIFEAFPDLLQILDATTYASGCAIRWRAPGTFAGPGRFQGFEHNGARIAIEGCDVFTAVDGPLVHNDAFLDSGDVARQLGLLPAGGLPAGGPPRHRSPTRRPASGATAAGCRAGGDRRRRLGRCAAGGCAR